MESLLYYSCVVSLAFLFVIYKRSRNKKANVCSEVATEQISDKEINNSYEEDEYRKLDSCIGEIVDLIAVKIGNENREINPRDAILCSGNLIGMFMFLSFNFNYKKIEPGNVLLSQEANEVGPKVINHLLNLLKKHNINIDNTDNSNIYKSSLTYIEILERLQKDAMEIMKKYYLDYDQAILICISAAAFIIENLSSEIDVNEGYGIAIYGIVEGSKTVPF